LPPPEVLPVAISARLTLQLQSSSLAEVQPAGQQPSLLMHWVMGVPVQVPAVHLLLDMQTLLLVQAMPSLAGAPPPQAPPVHVWPPRQGFRVEQLVPSEAGPTWQAWNTSEQALTWHVWLVGGQTMGLPMQVPLVHLSLRVQKRPSSQVVLLGRGVLVHPFIGSQLAVLQLSLSHEQSTGVLPMQAPEAQVPLLKHMSFMGVHDAPSLPGMVVHDWVASTHFPTLQASAPGHILGMPVQTPIMHTSFMVQNWPSSQVAPSLAGIFWQTLLKHAPVLQASATTAQSDWWRQGTGASLGASLPPSAAPAPPPPPVPLVSPPTPADPPAEIVSEPFAHELPPAAIASARTPTETRAEEAEGGARMAPSIPPAGRLG
jgi:hypothetical protein